MDAIETLILALGLGWASGINLYAAVLVVGLLGAHGAVVLPPDLEVLTHPLVIGSAGFLYVVEFCVDKLPGIDSGWDALHTFVRIPAGAALAAAAVGDLSPPVEVAAFLLGGSLAATSHATKAGSRVALNASPEPVTNWTASVAEDAAVLSGVWAALVHPWIFAALLVGFLIFAAWLLPRIWSGAKRAFGLLGRLVRRARPPSSA